jgi:CMP-N,N'-diacetyllegionaminic acid synthase
VIEGKKVLAVVPARGGSKGLPDKNIRALCGKPLLAWPIGAAMKSQYVDRVIVSTENARIAKAARRAGAEVPFMRPIELATDTAKSVDVIVHALHCFSDQKVYYDYVIILEPTSPLTEASDVDTALQMLHKARERADSIVGISLVGGTHPDFDVRLSGEGLISPYASSDFSSLKRRQDVEPIYFMEGSLYVSAVDVFLARRTFYHDRTLGYVVPRWKSFEVDELMDLICIKAIMARRDELRSLAD